MKLWQSTQVILVNASYPHGILALKLAPAVSGHRSGPEPPPARESSVIYNGIARISLLFCCRSVKIFQVVGGYNIQNASVNLLELP